MELTKKQIKVLSRILVAGHVKLILDCLEPFDDNGDQLISYDDINLIQIETFKIYSRLIKSDTVNTSLGLKNNVDYVKLNYK